MQTANNPIDARVDVAEEAQRGHPLKLTVKVTNDGQRDTDVKVWVQSNDPQSEELLAWWRDRHKTDDSVFVEKQDTKPITLDLSVPEQVDSDLYRYEVFIEASQYDRYRLKLSQNLKILPSENKGLPYWTIEPPMRREKPLEVEVGQSAIAKVRVQNVSDITESFSLECDFNSDWYEIIYPFNRRSLKVNPGDVEEVALKFDIPSSAISKIYSFTVRLNSYTFSQTFTNIVYLRVNEFYGEQNEGVVLQVNPQKILLPRKEVDTNNARSDRNKQYHWGEFQLRLENISNIKRHVIIQSDLEFQELLKFEFIKIERDYSGLVELDRKCTLSPGEVQYWVLQLKPKLFRAPIRREDRSINFTLQLENDSKDGARSLAKEETSRMVVWKRSPFQVWLILGLIAFIIALAILGVAAVVLWRMLYMPPTPSIAQFKVEEITADSVNLGNVETDSTGILADWEIDDAQQLDSVLLIYTDAEGKSKKKRYRIGGGRKPKVRRTLLNLFGLLARENKDGQNDPLEQLDRQNPKTFPCQKANEDLEDLVLTCSATIEQLQASTDYTFELQVFPRNYNSLFGVRKRKSDQPSDSLTTETKSFPSPRIQDLQAVYSVQESEQVELSWEQKNFDRLDRVRVVRKSEKGETKTYVYTRDELDGLNCFGQASEPSAEAGSPNPSGQAEREKQPYDCRLRLRESLPPDTYTFEVEVFSTLDPDRASDIKTAKETITLDEPRILSFASAKPNYQAPDETVLFNWAIENPQQVRSLVLKIMASDGSNRQEFRRYEFGDFRKQNFSSGSLGACQVTGEGAKLILQCQGIEADPLEIGTYKFELSVVPRAKTDREIAKQSDAVTIEPERVASVRLGGGGGEGAGSSGSGSGGGAGAGGVSVGRPKDVLFLEDNTTFSVNGKPVTSDGGSFLFAVNPGGNPEIVELKWNVNTEGRDVKIALLPLLEEVEPTGNFLLPLPEAGVQYTVSLQIANELGEIETRTAVIQTHAAQAPIDPVAPIDPTPAEPDELLPEPEEEELVPLEVPPQPD